MPFGSDPLLFPACKFVNHTASHFVPALEKLTCARGVASAFTKTAERFQESIGNGESRREKSRVSGLNFRLPKYPSPSPFDRRMHGIWCQVDFAGPGDRAVLNKYIGEMG